MIKAIIRELLLMPHAFEPATGMDSLVARDLMDTLEANKDRCVGMAANMIGINKRIIAVRDGTIQFVMFNPVIVRQSGEFEAEEGCLSLDGKRKTIRYQQIEVEYQDQLLRKRTGTYKGWIAQIIQHEIDHCNGKLV